MDTNKVASRIITHTSNNGYGIHLGHFDILAIATKIANADQTAIEDQTSIIRKTPNKEEYCVKSEKNR